MKAGRGSAGVGATEPGPRQGEEIGPGCAVLFVALLHLARRSGSLFLLPYSGGRDRAGSLPRLRYDSSPYLPRASCEGPASSLLCSATITTSDEFAMNRSVR
jgi:hypothetical protein